MKLRDFAIPLMTIIGVMVISIFGLNHFGAKTARLIYDEESVYEHGTVLTAINVQSRVKLSMRMRVETSSGVIFDVSTENPLLFAVEGSQVCLAILESWSETRQRARLVGGGDCKDLPESR